MEGARPFVDADFPGYAGAVARENTIRGAACLGLNEKICGLEVKPLTAYHVRLLTMIRSPFLLKTVTTEMLAVKPDIVDDVMRFLWIVSPMFKLGVQSSKSSWHSWRLGGWYPFETERDEFNRVFAPIIKQRIDVICREILEYVDEAYIDGRPAAGSDKSYYEFEIEIADEFHEHYGYRVDFWNNPQPSTLNPLHVPLKLVFQFRKRRAEGRGDMVENQSERYISAGLEKMKTQSSTLNSQPSTKI
jgi:hypothetical protein